MYVVSTVGVVCEGVWAVAVNAAKIDAVESAAMKITVVRTRIF
jgi:hypothetical protein